MDESVPDADRTTDIRWERASGADRAEPIVERRPYVELALEHPDLEPTAYGESFFPDAVPYAFEGTHRAFYWRPALEPGSDDPSEWSGVCATTASLSPVTTPESDGFDLVSRRDETTAVIVDGTIAGDSTRAIVESYTAPDVRIRALSASRLELLVDGSAVAVPAGTRRHVSLAERTVERVDSEGGPTETAPELRVRFPGQRELHHPALGADYRLFPSFGLDLETVPSPLAVPTANGELDHEALAASLGVDLSERPYPERVLWQAFAYTAFDPHADSAPVLWQFPTGYLALSSDRIGGAD